MTRRNGALTAAQYREAATEAEMEGAVRQLVQLRGGRLFHLRRGDAAPELADLPDWLIILPPFLTAAREWTEGCVFLIEAKSRNRQVTPGQSAVFDLLAGCTGLEYGIVRCGEPQDGEGSFDALLARLAGEAA